MTSSKTASAQSQKFRSPLEKSIYNVKELHCFQTLNPQIFLDKRIKHDPDIQFWLMFSGFLVL